MFFWGIVFRKVDLPWIQLIMTTSAPTVIAFPDGCLPLEVSHHLIHCLLKLLWIVTTNSLQQTHLIYYAGIGPFGHLSDLLITQSDLSSLQYSSLPGCTFKNSNPCAVTRKTLFMVYHKRPRLQCPSIRTQLLERVITTEFKRVGYYKGL